MSRTGWKQVERDAAALIGAKRHWANSGERVDADSPLFAQQAKNPKEMPLAELERLVEEMTLLGIDSGRIPMVVVKRSAGRPTPTLVVLPAEAWLIVRLLAGLDKPGLKAADGEAIAARYAKLSFGGLMRDYLHELPGARRRVAAYVEKSKRRGKR